MYCPMCLNDTLSMRDRGVIHLIVNGKQMDTGRFLYNILKESPEELNENFEKKLEEFFRWYSNFQNKDPIQYIHICSSDFRCEKGCGIHLGNKYSVVDVLIPREVVLEKLEILGEKYDMIIELEERDY